MISRFNIFGTVQNIDVHMIQKNYSSIEFQLRCCKFYQILQTFHITYLYNASSRMYSLANCVFIDFFIICSIIAFVMIVITLTLKNINQSNLYIRRDQIIHRK